MPWRNEWADEKQVTLEDDKDFERGEAQKMDKHVLEVSDLLDNY